MSNRPSLQVLCREKWRATYRSGYSPSVFCDPDPQPGQQALAVRGGPVARSWLQLQGSPNRTETSAASTATLMIYTGRYGGPGTSATGRKCLPTSPAPLTTSCRYRATAAIEDASSPSTGKRGGRTGLIGSARSVTGVVYSFAISRSYEVTY